MTEYIRHKSDEEKIKLGGVYDEDRGGNRVIRFIEEHLVLESGKKFQVLPWMRAVIHSWYSWFRPDGLRFTKVGLLTCARKNGKSILTYGLTAYHLLADGMNPARCASVAVDREQAAQIYDWFTHAIEANPKLSAALHAINHKKTVVYPKKNGSYRSMSSDASGKMGHGLGFVCCDEMAFWKGKKDDLYKALKDSGDAIPNSMQVLISTAGFDKNTTFFKQCQYAKKVLSGEIIDTTFQPWIFETPESADLDDEANWYLANPSLGVTKSVEEFRHKWQRDKQEATSKHTACVLQFNMYKDAENVWISPEAWDACKTVLPNLEGKPVVLGIDVGATRDLTNVGLVAPLDDKRVAVKSWSFVPEGAMQNRDGNSNLTHYQSFQRDGSLTITKGTATDEQEFCKFLDELCTKYNVRSVVFDKWQSLVVSNHLARKGIDVFNFPQSHSYFNAPAIEFEKLVSNKKLLHDGNSCLRWQIGHTYLHRDGKGYVKPETSRRENKRDSLIAILMALSQALQVDTAPAKPSVYETRGVSVLAV